MGHGLYNGTSIPWVMDCTMVVLACNPHGSWVVQQYLLMDYISRLWENISKKGKFSDLSQEKYVQKRNLCKQTVGIYFQKRKVSEFSKEKIFPKEEIIIDYVIRLWDPLAIYRNSNRLHKLALQQDYQIGILDSLLKQVT